MFGNESVLLFFAIAPAFIAAIISIGASGGSNNKEGELFVSGRFIKASKATWLLLVGVFILVGGLKALSHDNDLTLYGAIGLGCSLFGGFYLLLFSKFRHW